jgi:hypothetical protein
MGVSLSVCVFAAVVEQCVVSIQWCTVRNGTVLLIDGPLVPRIQKAASSQIEVTVHIYRIVQVLVHRCVSQKACTATKSRRQERPPKDNR